MKILTISIAAYNVRDYIRQTLDSLTDERVIDALEVFVVDDGGTDGTLDIAKEYAARYPDSIFPIHKENGGYGTTVNYSIAHATGKYFKLLDGDDWFDINGLVALVDILKKTDADIVLSPWKTVTEDGEKKLHAEKDVPMNTPVRLSEVDRVRQLSAKSITARTDAVKRAGIDLPSKSLYTDVIFTIKVLAAAGTIYYSDDCVYCYRLGRAGQSVDAASRAKHYKEGMNVSRISTRFYEACKASGNSNRSVLLWDAAFVYCVGAVKCIMCLEPKTGKAVLKQFEKESRNISKDVYDAALRYGKAGLMLRLLRLTGYMAFPLAKAVFDRQLQRTL